MKHAGSNQTPFVKKMGRINNPPTMTLSIVDLR
jgi:hypothetical protein